jgi:hypothetical protein
MSRGRPSRMACKAAFTRAVQRGVVLDAAGVMTSRIDFILFVRDRVRFVRVKRSHSLIGSPGELTVQFRNEIASIRKVPLTPVVSLELWVFLPWGTWQYFSVGEDTVTEIREETGTIPGTCRDPVIVPDQRDSVPAGAGGQRVLSPGPEITSPDIP